jgi:hypothetical protein
VRPFCELFGPHSKLKSLNIIVIGSTKTMLRNGTIVAP